MSKQISLNINLIWIRLTIIMSIMCLIIFIVAYILLKQAEILLYILATLPPIFSAIKMKNTPYAKLSDSKIEVYTIFGTLKNTYEIKKHEKFIIKRNKIYLLKSKNLIKLKLNHWFVNKHEWQRVIDKFSRSENDNIMSHLIDD